MLRPISHYRRVIVAAVLILGSCEGDGRPQGEGAETTGAGGPRIVSLSPAISRTLADLELAPLVVGRSAFCESLDPSIPAVGDLLHADYERLVRLDPTHVLVQPPARGTDEALLRLAAVHGWTVRPWRLDSVDDIEQLILDLPGVLFDAGDPRRIEAAARAATLSSRVAAALTPGPSPPWRGRTILVSGTEPVLAFGHGTYLHDVLVALGGRNATDATGWVTLSLEDVTRLDPEAIVLVTAGDGSATSAPDRLGPLATLPVSAVREGRLAVLAHPTALLPSTGVIEVASELRRILLGFAEPKP